MNKSVVLVGGGSGFVGKQIIKALLTQSKHSVAVVTRDVEEAKKTIFADPELRKQADNIKFESWRNLDKINYNVIGGINVSGKSIFDNRWSEDVKRKLYSSRIDTSREMVQFLASRAQSELVPLPFVGTSAVGYYPVNEKEDKVYDEYSEVVDHAPNALSELCHAIEQAIKDQVAKSGGRVRSSVVRPGAVLGSSGGALMQMALPFTFGFTFYPNHGDQPFPFIHLHDLARLYVHTMDQMEGPVNGVAPQIITSREFSQALSRALNRSFLPMVPFPAVVLKTVLGAERSLLLNEGQRVVPTKALKSNFVFEYPDIESTLGEIKGKLHLTQMIKSML